MVNGNVLERKMVPPGVEPRASCLNHQCSATELQHPLTTIPLYPYDLLKVIVLIRSHLYNNSKPLTVSKVYGQ